MRCNIKDNIIRLIILQIKILIISTILYINLPMFDSPYQTDDFKKKRDELTTIIRLDNREKIFRKRRNIDTQYNPTTYLGTSNQQNTQLLIADYRFKLQIESFLQCNYDMTHFQDLISCINDTNIIKQHLGVIGIRKIVSVSEDPPIQAVIDAGLVPKMIAFVKQTQYPQLQLEAAWALTNVASGTTAQCNSIITHGGVPLFIQLLRFSSQGILDHAIWAIGNISSDCIRNRDMIIKLGGLRNLVHVVANTNHPSLINNGCWAISNLCRGTPLPEYQDVKAGIQILCKKIASQKITDKEILSNCCWAISHHSDSGPQGKIQLVCQEKIIPHLIKNLQSNQLSLIVPSIRILGNISSGTIQQTNQLLTNGILDQLQKLVYHQKKLVRREACWVTSNITAGSKIQTQAVLVRRQLLFRLFEMFNTQCDVIKRQICYVFSNLAYQGEPFTIFNLYKQCNIVRMYASLLTHEDYQTVEVSLKCLAVILKFGQKFKYGNANPFVIDLYNLQAIAVLQKLQYHKSDMVYQLASSIIMNFFEIINLTCL